MAWATRCQYLADLQEEGRCEPEGRVLHQTTLHDFLERSRVFVHATIAIEGRWRGFHAVSKTIRSSTIKWTVQSRFGTRMPRG